MKQLHEKYRPKTWAEVVGQDKTIARIDALRKRGLGGRVYFLSGPSGVGKTSIGKLIAAEVAEPDVAGMIQEIDASDLTPAKCREYEGELQMYGWGKGGRALLINEAHGLRRDTIRQMLVWFERLPSHVVIVLTTTWQGEELLFDGSEDASPLLSRCIELRLTNQGFAQAFAVRAKWIAEQEGLDGRDVSEYVKLMRSPSVKNNGRAALQQIEAGEMVA